MPSSTCTFDSPRGHELAARLDEPDGPVRATAVLAHCFTCSKDLRAARSIAAALRDRGFVVLSFDFTGLGASEGDFAAATFSHDVADLVAAAEYLEETIEAPALLIGHSLGGAAVLCAAARCDSVTAVATIGAPADVDHALQLIDEDDREVIREQGEATVDIGGRPFTVSAQLLDDLGSQPLREIVGDLRASTLFLHSPIDNVVGVDNAAELYTAAKHPKSYVSLDDADHLLSDPADARYVAEVIAAWAHRYLPERGPVEDGADETDDDVARTYADHRIVAVNRSGLKATVRARGFESIVDEPHGAGGTEQGPTPYDHLAIALGSCTSLTLRMYADRKGWAVEQIRTIVHHEEVHADDCEHCETEEGDVGLLTRRIELTGDLDDEQREKLLGIADRCPVHQTLEGTIEVHTELAG